MINEKKINKLLGDVENMETFGTKVFKQLRGILNNFEEEKFENFVVFSLQDFNLYLVDNGESEETIFYKYDSNTREMKKSKSLIYGEYIIFSYKKILWFFSDIGDESCMSADALTFAQFICNEIELVY